MQTILKQKSAEHVPQSYKQKNKVFLPEVGSIVDPDGCPEKAVGPPAAVAQQRYPFRKLGAHTGVTQRGYILYIHPRTVSWI